MRVDPLVHPVTLTAMAVLGLNDHWWKWAWPGWLTGKLSDLAGLVFFPTLLGALRLPRVVAVAATVTGFTLVKTASWANDLWNACFSALYPVLGLGSGARLLRDPTDLLALPAVLVPLALTRPRGPR